MRRAAQSHGRESGRYRRGERRIVSPGQDHGQGAGPECRGEPQRAVIEPCEPFRCRKVGDMYDQRIEIRPALRPVDRCYRSIAVGPGGEAVNRLGRDRDQPAAAQQRGCRRDRLRVGRPDRGFVVARHGLPL